MALDLAPDALIRAGSGVLFVLLSFFVLATSRWRVGHLLLGTVFLGFGSYFLLANVARGAPWWPVAYFAAPGLAATFVFPTRARGREAAATAGALALGVVLSAVLVGFPFAGDVAPLTNGNTISRAVAIMAFLAWTARATSATSEERVKHAALALALGPYAAWHAGNAIVDVAIGETLPAYLLVTAGVAASALVWIATEARHADRIGLRVGLLILALMVGGAFKDVLYRTPGIDTTGTIGLARIAGWAIIVWAILRHDLLDIGLRGVAIRRGTIGAASLAALFVVAQVAQSFFSAQYGLIMGGVVAGAMLFAASPIQRAVERLQTPAPASASAPAPWSDERAVKAYRHAVRAALNDGALNAAEEEHLAEVAETLGIGAAQALRLRREEEALLPGRS